MDTSKNFFIYNFFEYYFLYKLINQFIFKSYNESASDAWVPSEKLKKNCSELIKTFERAERKSKQEKRKADNELPDGPFKRFYRGLGPTDCQIAAVGVYFNRQLFITSEEFYTAQCIFNRISRIPTNMHDIKITKKIKVDNISYIKKYIWRSSDISLRKW